MGAHAYRHSRWAVEEQPGRPDTTVPLLKRMSIYLTDGNTRAYWQRWTKLARHRQRGAAYMAAFATDPSTRMLLNLLLWARVCRWAAISDR